MTDLTNAVLNMPVSEMEILYKLYTPVLQIIVKEQNQLPFITYILHISFNHLTQNHKDVPADWKTWAVVVVKNCYFNNKLNFGEDIIKTIEDFISYYKKEYQNYVDNLGMYASEYDRDYNFVVHYMNKKNR